MMLTGRRFVAVALVVGLCAIAAAGCHRKNNKGSTTINGSDIFTTDEFPGSSVQDNNVADDQRAFSVAGADFAGSLQVVFNGDRCVAIATYRVTATVGALRYVHYYDGTWTPPVAVGAVDCDLTSVGATAAVAFLNTENHSSDFAQERNGDAIVLWTANDGASAVVGDGVNRNLYATYFNVRNAGDISMNYGFEPFAQRLSNEDDNVAATGEDVTTFGFVSDGLCGESRWANSFVNYQWGDETTEIIAFWRQSQDNDAAAGYQDDQYWAYSRFDLGAAVTSDLPLTGTTATRGPILGFGASDSGLTSEESQVFGEFISYNNVLFFKVSDDADAGSLAGYVPSLQTSYGVLSTEDKITVQEVAFGLGTATVSSPQTLHASSPSAAIGDTNQSNADYAQDKGGFGGRKNSMYGSDQGIATLTVFSVQLVTDPNTVFGEVTADGRLRVTEIDEASGSLIAAGASNIDGEDIDISDTVTVFDSRMSRNGDYIWVAWQENIDAGAAGVTTEDQVGAFAAEYITTRIQDDGTFPAPPAISSTLSGNFQLNTIITVAAIGQPVAGFQFQNSLGYICGLQSDPDVMHIFFEHSDSTGDTVWDARLTADLDPAGGCSPIVSAGVWEGFSLNGDQSDWALFGPNLDHFDWKAFDSGDNGDALTFYEQDIDATASTDFRIHSEKNGVAGGKVEIDSVTTDRQTSGFSLIDFAATELGSSIGLFDIAASEDSEDRPKALNTLDVFFIESQVSEVDGLPTFRRTRRFSSGDLSVSFGDQFTPSAGTLFEEPFYPGLPGGGSSSNSLVAINSDGEMPVSGGTVGVYFLQGSRLYYQESDSSGSDNGELGWANNEGVSNPFLVDDDNDEELQNFRGLFVRSCSCDKLDCSMIFWSKAFGSGSGGGLSERLQVRVRDGNSN